MQSTESVPQPIAVEAAPQPAAGVQRAAMGILLALSFCHLLNDSIQALLPSIYPMLKDHFSLNFTQIGLITFAFQMAGSIFQPVVGWYTDRRPQPFSLCLGMGLTLVGLVGLAFAPSYGFIVASAIVIGLGSAIFHPEASRISRLASGGRHGFAQSLFQVGGNAGSSIGPLLAAYIVVPHGQVHLLWFTLAAFAGIVILRKVGFWYREQMARHLARAAAHAAPHARLPRRTVIVSLAILATLIFSKFFYLVSMTNYLTFYLIDRFGLSIHASQIHLFVFLFAVAAGTIVGGPVGDRIGRKAVIWVSILGIAPFTLALPHVGLVATSILTVIIGAVLASAMPAILVYATELVPGRIGAISGLFFGLSFGMAGIGAAVLGWLADRTSIGFVYQVCAFLPLIGLLTVFLPEPRKKKA